MAFLIIGAGSLQLSLLTCIEALAVTSSVTLRHTSLDCLDGPSYGPARSIRADVILKGQS
jgi:hypothetical protein